MAFSSLFRRLRPSTLALLLPPALLLGGAVPVLAQREVRHLNVLSPVVGTCSTGRYGQLTYGRFISDRTRFELVGALERGPAADPALPAAYPAYQAYEVGIGFAPQLLHVAEIFYLRMPFQLRTRYERQLPVGEQVSSGFSVGPSLGVSAEVYAEDRLSFSAEFRQGWYPLGSPVAPLPRYAGVGLSLYFGQ